MPPDRARLHLLPSPTPARAVSAGTAAPDGAPAGAEQGPVQLVPERDFEPLYAQHFEFVWRSLRLLGVEESALADATQDVFSVVARQLSSFQGRSSLRTWVFGIAQHTAANHRRRRARKQEPLRPVSDTLPSAEPSPHAHAEGREAAELIVHFCSELEESRRAVFVLGLLEGVPAQDIAALLGLPLNTVYTRMHTLRKALQRRLEEREREP